MGDHVLHQLGQVCFYRVDFGIIANGQDGLRQTWSIQTIEPHRETDGALLVVSWAMAAFFALLFDLPDRFGELFDAKEHFVATSCQNLAVHVLEVGVAKPGQVLLYGDPACDDVLV